MALKRHKKNEYNIVWSECLDAKHLAYAKNLSCDFGVGLEFRFSTWGGYEVWVMRQHHDGYRVYAVGCGDTGQKAFRDGIRLYNERPNCEKKTVNLPDLPNEA